MMGRRGRCQLGMLIVRRYENRRISSSYVLGLFHSWCQVHGFTDMSGQECVVLAVVGSLIGSTIVGVVAMFFGHKPPSGINHDE